MPIPIDIVGYEQFLKESRKHITSRQSENKSVPKKVRFVKKWVALKKIEVKKMKRQTYAEQRDVFNMQLKYCGIM